MGLTPQYISKADRFEVDGANSARAFLRRHNISQQEIDTVWSAIALHTTPGIPQYMHPVVALLTNGVEMDVLGIALRGILRRRSRSDRRRVCNADHYDHRLEDDHWEQPGNLFRKITPAQKQLLFDNTARAIKGASQEVLERHVATAEEPILTIGVAWRKR
jgi:hypothetical protein